MGSNKRNSDRASEKSFMFVFGEIDFIRISEFRGVSFSVTTNIPLGNLDEHSSRTES